MLWGVSQIIPASFGQAGLWKARLWYSHYCGKLHNHKIKTRGHLLLVMSWGASNSGPVATSGGWGSSPSRASTQPAPTSTAGWGATSSGPARTMSSNSARPASPAATSASPKPTSTSGWGATSSGGTAAPKPASPAATPARVGSTGNSSWGNNGAAKPASGWGAGGAAKPANSSWSSSGSGGDGFSSWGAATGWGNSTASSWASTPAAQTDDAPKPGGDSAWANDAMAAGQEAYQAFVDEMNLKQDVSVTTGRILVC